MKETFVNFLKDNNAYISFIKEVEKEGYTLGEVLDEAIPAFHELLEDGFCFDYDKQVSDVDWKELDGKWKAFYARVKIEFIDFLKKNHALREFEKELKEVELDFKEIDMFSLDDGQNFFWAEQVTHADWSVLSLKWHDKFKGIKC